MTQSSKEEILQKWAPIIESMGVTGSKADWMSQYAEKHSLNENQICEEQMSSAQSSFPSIMPMVKQVAAKTIGLDLVTVKPIGRNSEEELDKIKKEVKTENRDRKIDAITEDRDFEEMKVEEHPDYEKMPESKLFYLDYKYESSKPHKKTRRSKKKKK